MFEGLRAWFRRNRTTFAVGAGVVAGGYLAGQYVLAKITEARQRLSDERIAKENLRRRFEQNQEDCTFTVLAILPTATDNIVEALPAEDVLNELQRQKQERLARSGALSEVSTVDLSSAPPSVAPTEIDGKSLTNMSESESYVHASQVGTTDSGELLSPHAPRRSKAQMWNDLKIHSIARAFTLLYTLAFLTLLTRIQLNLLGRRNYLASVVSLASPPQSSPEGNNSHQIFLENHDDDNFETTYGNDYETNRKYLSFSWWLLHRGCRDIMQKVLAAVKEVFGPLNPREDISLERLSQLTVEVRKRVEGATEAERRTMKYLPYLLPPASQEAAVLKSVSGSFPTTDSPFSTTAAEADTIIPPTLRRLLDESADLIDSPSFHTILTSLLDAGFSLLVDAKIAQLAYKIPQPSASMSTSRVVEFVDPATARTKVANTLAIFCRQAHVIGSGGQAPPTSAPVGAEGGAAAAATVAGGNEYLAAMEQVRDLEAFAAVVYSSNFDFEAPDAAAAAVAAAAAAAAASQQSATSTSKGGRDATGMPQVGEPTPTPGREEGGGFDAAWEKATSREDGR